jgi:TolA-binding protein
MKNKTLAWCVWLLLINVIILTGNLALAVVVSGEIIKKDGQRLRGNISYSASSRSYSVTSGNMTLTVQASDVAKVVVTKPKELDAAISKVKAGQYAVAVNELRAIMAEYKGLGWDNEAARWMLECYLKLKNPGEVERIYDLIKESDPDRELPEYLVRLYWDALIELKKFAKLEKEISLLIGTGSRKLSALACLVRGDIRYKQGKQKEALVDGYLRVALLYKDIKELQPEALKKCVKCFKELGQHSYAEKMRKILLTDFPQSKEAEELKTES